MDKEEVLRRGSDGEPIMPLLRAHARKRYPLLFDWKDDPTAAFSRLHDVIENLAYSFLKVAALYLIFVTGMLRLVGFEKTITFLTIIILVTVQNVIRRGGK